jgi:pimeloyl-ACP methyl ester carboxylesterase
MQQLGLPWPFDIREIGVPTTIWHGEEDRTCGIAIADYFAKNIPGARLHVRPGKGHFFLFGHWHEILSKLVNEHPDAKP